MTLIALGGAVSK